MTDSLPPAGALADATTDALAAALAHIPPGALDFLAAPDSGRRDGWTVERQRGFVVALAAGLGVSGAARAVGMSRQGAYQLRNRPGAEDFAAACDRALRFARARPLPPGTSFRERALEGVLVPLSDGHRIVGWRRRYDRRALLMALRAQYRDGRP